MNAWVMRHQKITVLCIALWLLSTGWLLTAFNSTLASTFATFATYLLALVASFMTGHAVQRTFEGKAAASIEVAKATPKEEEG